jgi:hypothetical protein
MAVRTGLAFCHVLSPPKTTWRDDIVRIYCVVYLDRSLRNMYTTQRRRLGGVTEVNKAMFGEQTLQRDRAQCLRWD